MGAIIGRDKSADGVRAALRKRLFRCERGTLRWLSLVM